MTPRCYRVLSCEGADQVGKADAIQNLRKELLGRGLSLTQSSFPIYATPIGMAIRLFLKNGMHDLKISSSKELDIRMSLFALNRLEFLEVFLSNEKYENTLLILDRSSFSNAVTIAYGLSVSSDIGEKEIKELVEYALDLDSLMIEQLNLKKCVIELISKEVQWGNIRERNIDYYECKEVQDKCRYIYDLYAQKVGEGWNKVVTKDSSGWRDRKEILGESMDILNNSFPDLYKLKNSKDYQIGIEEILSKMYPDAKVSSRDIDKYVTSLDMNEKEVMYDYAVQIGKSISESVETVNLENPLLIREFRRIIAKNKEIIDVLEYFTTKSFCSKLLRACKYE